jgi:hypothetical protein
VITHLPLTGRDQGKLLEAVYPAGDRRYYRIDESDLNEFNRKELLRKYREALKSELANDDLTVFAITNQNETFLLPGFFKLDEVQQAAILFHEALWVIDPKLTYGFVIDAEITLEDYLRRNTQAFPYETDLFLALSTALGNPILTIMAAAKDDFNNGRLSALLNREGQLPIETLLGKQNIKCYSENDGFVDRATFVAHLTFMMRTRPEIKLYEALFALRDRVRIEADASFYTGYPSTIFATPCSELIWGMVSGFTPWEFVSAGAARDLSIDAIAAPGKASGRNIFRLSLKI